MAKQRALTPAEQEAERKRQEAAWWNKVIAYYLNQMYHREVEREIEKYRTEPLLISTVAGYFKEQSKLRKLMESEPGKLSAMQILADMSVYQEENSAFTRLLKDIKENGQDEAKITASLNRCAEEAPKEVLNRERRRSERKKREQLEQREEPQDPESRRKVELRNRRRAELDAREERRLNYEMTFLRSIMEPERYRQLCAALSKEGRRVDPMKDFLFIAARDRERGGPSYEEYTAMHKVDPVERNGQLANMDEIVTSAAYMLAAFEQKDEPDFDAKAADARAMELSGSKGFRAYVGSHPGSLLAAARNTGIAATHREMTALEDSIRKRDGVLASVAEAMQRSSSGKTASYHQVMNAIKRFAASPDDPPEQARNDLSMKLAQYVMTEGNPASPHYKKEDAMLAARAMKALLPKRDFEAFLSTANLGRMQDQLLRSEELEGPVPRGPERQAPVREGPVLERERNDG